MNRPHVLHITCDHPDTVRVEKTRAVANLIERSTSLRHTIFSLNRSTRPFNWTHQENLYSINYCAPPFGIFMRQGLNRVIERLTPLLNIDFDIIHAHKFSIEGIIGAQIAKMHGKPLLITVRGHSDLNIIRAKPHYRYMYRKVAAQAAHFFFLAPWTSGRFQKTIGHQLHSFSFLPNITQNPHISQTRQSDRFVTTVNYASKNHRAKNLDIVLRAFEKLIRRPGHAHLGLDLFTTPSLIPGNIRAMLSSPSLKRTVRIRNLVHNDRFIKHLPAYIAFVRPSYPETFGMVYIESLLAGVPTMHSINTAIDGYFDNYDFIKKVRPRSIMDVETALADLADKQENYKLSLAHHLSHGTFRRFSPEMICSHYQKTITNILNNFNRHGHLHPAA